MLTVAKIVGSDAAGYAAYLEGKSSPGELGDYYLKHGERVEAPGRWVSGASAVGVDPHTAVAPEELRDLMAVRYPGTDRPLRRTGGNGQAVAALDATFSAPKSVSAIWALGDEGVRAEIEFAHERAITSALQYSLRYVAMTRQRVDAETVIHTKAQDLIATSWRHSTARAVADRLPDPQLHSHVLLHAAVRSDGVVVAIDSRAWKVHRREIGAAYRTELARELAQIGFEIQRNTGRGGRYFEIAGVPQELLDRWSSRNHQIQEAIDANVGARRERLQEQIKAGGREAKIARGQLKTLERYERLPPAEDRLLGVKSRAAKNQATTAAELDDSWTAVGLEHGVDRARLEMIRSVEPIHPPMLDRAALKTVLVEFDATFLAKDARAVALEHSAGVPWKDTLGVLRGMAEDGEVLLLADGTRTTDSHRRTEADVLASTDRLLENELTSIDAKVVHHSQAVTNKQLAAHGGRLSAEQQAAMRLASGERQLVMIEGQAGTGKSTVLQAVARAHQDEGRQVIVTSTGALAAQRLANDLADAGVDAPAYSTAGLLHAVDAGRIELDPDTTIIHDEAALASTQEQRRLFDLAEDTGARLIMVGDPEQSRAVGAGGLWRHIEGSARDQGAHVELTENLRARDPADRRDQHYFRHGEHRAALSGYDQRGRVLLEDDLRLAEDRAQEAAHEDRRAGRETIVIAQTSNDHLDELNARAQALRAQDGQLGTDAISLPDRPYDLHAGDQIQIRHNTVVGEDRELLRNGTMAQVTAVDSRDRSATLRLGDRQIELTGTDIDAADLRLAYVQHPVPAQGLTTDTAHLIVGEHTNRKGSYVAITRPRDQAHIYAGLDILVGDIDEPELARLAETVGRDEPDLPAIATPVVEPGDRPVRVAPSEPNGQDPAVAPDRETLDHLQGRIVAYRRSHGIREDQPELLGPEPPAGAFAQRFVYRQLAAEAREAGLSPADGTGHEIERTSRGLVDTGYEP